MIGFVVTRPAICSVEDDIGITSRSKTGQKHTSNHYGLSAQT
jgi:hypothetical protein